MQESSRRKLARSLQDAADNWSEFMGKATLVFTVIAIVAAILYPWWGTLATLFDLVGSIIFRAMAGLIVGLVITTVIWAFPAFSMSTIAAILDRTVDNGRERE